MRRLATDGADPPKQRDREDTRHDQQYQHYQCTGYLMSSEENRGPGQIERELHEKDRDRKATSARPPGRADQGEG